MILIPSKDDRSVDPLHSADRPGTAGPRDQRHRPGKWSHTSGIRDELFLDKPYQISEEKDVYYSTVQHNP